MARREITKQEPIESKLTVTVSDLMCIASNAIVIMSDFVDKLEDETDLTAEVQSSVDEMKEFLKSQQPKDYMDLDSDFSLDAYEVIMTATFNEEPKEKDEVLATTRGGIINVTGRLAEYQSNIQMAEIGTVELLADMERSGLAEKDFWLNKAIRTDLTAIHENLIPFLADTQRTRS
jgi:hypothetical protein